MDQSKLIEITHIFVSDGHNFAGNQEKNPDMFPGIDMDVVEAVKDSGLRGDRYFRQDPDFDGHVTFFQQEVHDELKAAFGLNWLTADRYRRNVCVKGFDIHTLVGKEFSINGVHFYATELAEPCRWMNVSVNPEAEKFLKGRAGIRAQILSTGFLRKGFAELVMTSAQTEMAF